jgi:cysteine sulfinate desulfinase/cysteine desulfurase-like protein
LVINHSWRLYAVITPTTALVSTETTSAFAWLPTDAFPIFRSGGTPEMLHSAMRFSLSPLLTEAESDEAARRIAGVVGRLRRMGDDLGGRRE